MYSIVEKEVGHIELSGVVCITNADKVESELLAILQKSNSTKLFISDLNDFDSSLAALLLSLQRNAVKNNINLYLMLKQHNIEMLLKSYNAYELFTYLN